MKKVFGFLSKVGCVILLSMLWLICSLPVVTLGASSAALYCACFDLQEGKENIFKNFFLAFVKKFKQGTLCWLTFVVCGLVLYCLPRLAGSIGIQMVIVAAVAICSAMILVMWVMLVCTFPLVGYFDNTVKKTMRNALFIAAKHRKQTLICSLLSLVPIVVLVVSPRLFLYTSGVWCLLFPGAFVYIAAGLFKPVLKKYEERQKEKQLEKKEEVSE